MRTTWSFHGAGCLLFGRGAVAQIGEQVRRLGARRVTILADRTLDALGLVEQVRQPLLAQQIAVQVCNEGEAEPAVATAMKAAELARPFSPEAIVGVGGGSNLDLAKIVAILLTHGGQPRDYFSFDNVPGPVLPLVCVPTTAGTGSEVSHAAVLTDAEQQIKVSTLSQYLRPAVAIVDPELTLTCPPKVTADSGIDALTHAIEAYTAVDFSALEANVPHAYQGRYGLGMNLAEQAISLIGQHLVTACREPRNMAAREGMALAATLAGLAFSNCAVALVHALEYPLGAVLHCSHGAGNGLLLPHVMRFNLPHRAAEFARVAELLGENTGGLAPSVAAERAIAAVVRLQTEIGIPRQLRDLGAKRDQLPLFAAKAYAIKRLLTVNPRPASEADLLAILEEAF